MMPKIAAMAPPPSQPSSSKISEKTTATTAPTTTPAIKPMVFGAIRFHSSTDVIDPAPLAKCNGWRYKRSARKTKPGASSDKRITTNVHCLNAPLKGRISGPCNWEPRTPTRTRQETAAPAAPADRGASSERTRGHARRRTHRRPFRTSDFVAPPRFATLLPCQGRHRETLCRSRRHVAFPCPDAGGPGGVGAARIRGCRQIARKVSLSVLNRVLAHKF